MRLLVVVLVAVVLAALRRPMRAARICRRLERAVDVVRAELDAVPRRMLTARHRRPDEWGEGAAAVVALHDDGVGWMRAWHDATRANPDWLNFGLVLNGQPLGRNAQLCPRTMAMLMQIDGLQVAGFSLLRAGGTIAEHVDHLHPASRTFHLGVRVPEACALVVGRRVLRHATGRAFWFDSRTPHRAANASAHERVVLYLDIRV